jgi:hypothetical protein
MIRRIVVSPFIANFGSMLIDGPLSQEGADDDLSSAVSRP